MTISEETPPYIPYDAYAAGIASVYLAHSYDHRDAGERLQRRIEDTVGIEVVNPFQRGEQELIEKYVAKGELPHPVCAMIVRMDLDKINKADGVVALIATPPSIGTSMEIFYAAYVLRKPVWSLYMPRADGRNHTHPWIKHLTSVHFTERSLLHALAVNTGGLKGAALLG